jgi:hypothetical protein
LGSCPSIRGFKPLAANFAAAAVGHLSVCHYVGYSAGTLWQATDLPAMQILLHPAEARQLLHEVLELLSDLPFCAPGTNDPYTLEQLDQLLDRSTRAFRGDIRARKKVAAATLDFTTSWGHMRTLNASLRARNRRQQQQQQQQEEEEEGVPAGMAVLLSELQGAADELQQCFGEEFATYELHEDKVNVESIGRINAMQHRRAYSANFTWHVRLS